MRFFSFYIFSFVLIIDTRSTWIRRRLRIIIKSQQFQTLNSVGVLMDLQWYVYHSWNNSFQKQATCQSIFCVLWNNGRIKLVALKDNYFYVSQRTLKPTIRLVWAANLRSLIRVFADRMCLLGYPERDKREPLPYWVDAQSDLSLCCLYVPLGI